MSTSRAAAKKWVRWGTRRLTLATALLGSMANSGCALPRRVPPLGAIYADAAQRAHLDRNPVVVLPGLLGSRLVHAPTGRTVWGEFGSRAFDPRSAEGAPRVAIPMVAGATLADRTDAVEAVATLDRLRVSFFGVASHVSAYAQILDALGIGGYLGAAFRDHVDYGDDHYTCFQFPYDWRRDLVESARAFDAFLDRTETEVQEQRRERQEPERPVRFDVVAHSMGGLVLRWYLRYGVAEPGPDGEPPPLTWAGARRIDTAVLVGTPNMGSIQALRELLQGYDPGALLWNYPAAVVGTFPSLYQLLPRGAGGALLDSMGQPVPDLLDPKLWIRERWGLLDPRFDGQLRHLLPHLSALGDRRSAAEEHLRLCLARARGVQAGLDCPAPPPPHTRLVLVAGDGERTVETMVQTTNGRLSAVEHGFGDGTVLRTSALGERSSDPSAPRRAGVSQVESWHQVLFLPANHLGLTADPTFTDNLLYLLLLAPRAEPSPSSATPSASSTR